jgi:predicted ATPase
LSRSYATVYELDENGITPRAYDELDAVRLMRGFLDSPDRYIRAALEQTEPA